MMAAQTYIEEERKVDRAARIQPYLNTITNRPIKRIISQTHITQLTISHRLTAMWWKNIKDNPKSKFSLCFTWNIKIPKVDLYILDITYTITTEHITHWINQREWLTGVCDGAGRVWGGQLGRRRVTLWSAAVPLSWDRGSVTIWYIENLKTHSGQRWFWAKIVGQKHTYIQTHTNFVLFLCCFRHKDSLQLQVQSFHTASQSGGQSAQRNERHRLYTHTHSHENQRPIKQNVYKWQRKATHF